MFDAAAGPAAPLRAAFDVRPMGARDHARLEALLGAVENFNRDEVEVALELIDEAAGPPPGCEEYFVLVAEADAASPLLGYACFGPTPMTRATFDLYWIATLPAARGRGVGAALHDAVVRAVRTRGGRRIRVETSSKESYGATQRFYDRVGYRQAGRVDNFYADGDHLLILVHEVDA